MSVKIKVYNQQAEAVKDLELEDKVFNQSVNQDLIHQVVVAQRANQRQVTAHTKDRSEVRGGGAKPWRQKGTGRARVGSNRSPIWIGGGVTFGPSKDRVFKKKINKKMKQQAIKMALSDRVVNNCLLVLDDLKVENYKTKDVLQILSNLNTQVLAKNKSDKFNILILNNDNQDRKLINSARNIEGVKVLSLDNINLLDLLRFEHVVATEEGIKQIQARYIK